MKSGKQRRAEIQFARKQKQQKTALAAKPKLSDPGTAPCNSAKLAPNNSYGIPEFVERGFYLDREFTCKDCGSFETWRATQQKWWYEVVKGNADAIAVRCRKCRRKERERKTKARRIHLEGITDKAAHKKLKPDG